MSTTIGTRVYSLVPRALWAIRAIRSPPQGHLLGIPHLHELVVPIKKQIWAHSTESRRYRSGHCTYGFNYRSSVHLNRTRRLRGRVPCLNSRQTHDWTGLGFDDILCKSSCEEVHFYASTFFRKRSETTNHTTYVH